MRTVENIRRFRLSDSFIEPYVKEAEVPWGPWLRNFQANIRTSTK
jgi:hypothetical protein